MQEPSVTISLKEYERLKSIEEMTIEKSKRKSFVIYEDRASVESFDNKIYSGMIKVPMLTGAKKISNI